MIFNFHFNPSFNFSNWNFFKNRRVKDNAEVSLNTNICSGTILDIHGNKHKCGLNYEDFKPKADFSEKDLSEADLSYLNLNNINFTKANLIGASLFNTVILNSNFSYANMSRVYLERAYIENSNFAVANLFNSNAHLN